MLKFVIMTIVTLAFVACQSSEVIVKKTTPATPKKYDESFDPNSLHDDDIVISGPAKTVDKKEETESAKKNKGAEFKEVNGFRVQIIVTKNIESATLVEEEARAQFKTDGYKTYLVFEGPLYKVRIGDARNRAEAEKIRDLARDLNYRDAYIVPSKVNVPVE